MKAVIGLTGIGFVEGVSQVPTDGTPAIEVGKLLIQLVIGVVTLFKMLKKPKAPQEQKEVLSNQNTQE